MEMADVAEVETGLSDRPKKKKKKSVSKEKGNGTSYQDKQNKHPYTTPEFWLDEANHFWKRSSMFKQEAYMGVVEQAMKDVKADLIIHSI